MPRFALIGADSRTGKPRRLVVEAGSEGDARDWAASESLLVANVFELEPPPMVPGGEAPPIVPNQPRFGHVNVSILEQTHTMAGWLHRTSSIGCGIVLGWALIIVLTLGAFIVFGAAIYNALPAPPASRGLRSTPPGGP